MMPASRNHFLDALRGIAALLVLATHLQSSVIGFYPSGWLAFHPQAAAVLEHGAIGVDVFFLISGFIVFLAARRVMYAGHGVRIFLLKRFVRIFLPYWPLALILGAAYALLPGFSASTDPIQINWIKSLTLIPGGGGAYSLPVAWTLSYELFFYLLLGLSLAFKNSVWRLGLIAAPSLSALLMYSVGAGIAFGKATDPLMLLASPYQFEFLLGCGVALLAAQRWHLATTLRSHRFVVSALLGAGALLLLFPFPFSLVYRFLLLLVLAALILLSTVRDFEGLPGLSVFAWVGGISYSLYLIHNPLQSLAIRLAVHFALPELAASVLLVLVPLLAAIVYFQIVETWSLRLMNRGAAYLNPYSV
jgi:peptidoglycan/LPS O-acetylase OafA/YrhL